MSDFKCPIHPHIINEKCCSESVEVKAEEPSVEISTGDTAESGDIVLPNLVQTEAPELEIDPVELDKLNEQAIHPLTQVVSAFDIDFIFMMLLCLPTWLFYLVVKSRFPEEHPWKRNMSIREWTSGSTKLNNVFAANFWVLGILWLSVLLHILRK